MKLPRRNDVRHRRSGVARRLLAWILTPVLVVTGLAGGIVGPLPAAIAAGDALVQVTVEPIDPATGATMTSTGPGQFANKVAYRVDFSCLIAKCDKATVKLDPTQLDPNHSYYRLLVQSGFTPPVTGGTISGSATDGYTVALGDLAAGASGSFTVEYSQAAVVGAPAIRYDNIGEYQGQAVSNFPPGFGIRQVVTGSADTAARTISATSTAVTWQNTASTPAVKMQRMTDGALSLPGVLATDTDYSYGVYMTTGCTGTRGDGGTTRRVTYNTTLCAEDYTVTHQLPPGAEVVSAAGNPTVSGSIATGLVLTWTDPGWATPTGQNRNAEAGWYSTDPASANGASPRQVTIRFPRANLAPDGESCNYEVTTGAWQSNVSVTYVGMPGVGGEVKTASDTVQPMTLRCEEPFGAATAERKTSTFDARESGVLNESHVTVPLAGNENLKQWQVTVSNRANVEGVAVVTDNTLDLADAPVYRIEATRAGTSVAASVAWTATDGVTTVSGTSTTPVNAPAGYRFATAVVTSPNLAAANQFPNSIPFKTDFSVIFKYKVTSTAPIGERRTNTASAVMTYPAYPQLADIPLTIAPHTIIFQGPFAKASGVKQFMELVPNDGVFARTEIQIPAGSATKLGYWAVDVRNRANVPGVPVVTDSPLSGPGGAPVTTIQGLYFDGSWKGWPSTVRFTLDDGTTGTVSLGVNQIYTAPAGRSIVAATVTGAEIGSVNKFPSGNDQTLFRVYFGFRLTQDSPPGTGSNTAQATMTWPKYPALDSVTTEVSATGALVAPPANFAATITRQAAGGATMAGPTTDVTFTVGGSTASVSRSRDITPQYVFVAPADWNITQGSASFPAGTVPAGVRFDYRTVTVGGVARQAVVATWPAGTVFGKNTTLPGMSVVARPGADIPAGTVGVPDAYIGNSAAEIASDVFARSFTDAPDLDGDGRLSERFASADTSNAGTPVGRVPALQVLKEICLPDADAADGCEWFADPSQRVGVPPNSTSIRYRLTVTNTGNTPLSDVVGYDVLPYPGDTGTSDQTGTVQRGSTIREQITSVSDVTDGVTLTYSNAEQPCRAEVDATVANCVDDWDSTETGAQAVRVSRPGTLAAGDSFSLQYTAAILENPGDGAVGCNSFAVRVTGLSTVSEPSPVCASVEETDLSVVAGTPQLQVGRPGVLPYMVTNNGGAPSTTGRVEVLIPEGLTATDFTFDGWTCTAADADGNPLFGSAPGLATLSCRPDQPLLIDAPRALNVPVVPAQAQFTSTAEVSGRLFDGDLDNNEDTMVATAFAAAGDVEVTKDDGVESARPGDLLTYTIDVHNPLLFESLSGATVTDQLPRGTTFVSASAGGTHSGGTVTWNLPDLAGDASATVTVTVRVLQTVPVEEIVNTASVTAPDPANAGDTLTGEATDTDTVIIDPELTLAKGSVSDEYAAVGDVITYTFSARNTGDVTLHDVAISDPLPGVSAVTYTWPGDEGVLAVGQTVTATATYTITQADLDAGEVTNTATVEGTAPNGVDEASAEDDHIVTSTATPSISLDKETASTVTAAGDEVTYSFRIANDGPLTLTGVTVTDLMPGLSDIQIAWPDVVGQLAPGRSITGTATYTARQSDVDAGQIVNTATATGRSMTGIAASDEDTETLAIERTQEISLSKEGVFTGGEDAARGETIRYTFTATNEGNTTLTGVEVSDPMPGLSDISYDWPGAEGVLAPGESVVATAAYDLTQVDVDAGEVPNTATVAGVSPIGDVTAEASEIVDFESTPVLDIEKVATGVVDTAGDLVTYSFTVTNNGTLTLSDVVVTDPMPGLSALSYEWPAAAGVLAPGESVAATATYRATQADVDAGEIVNTATATGNTPAGAAVSDDDTETLEIVRVSAVSLVKDGTFTGDVNEAALGDVIEYVFTATNDGNTTLTGVVVSDPLPGLTDLVYVWPAAEGVLLPGETVTATATYAVTQADLDAHHVPNSATVTGVAPDGDVADEDTRDIAFSSTPSISIDKETVSAVTAAGDQVTYTFTVINDGPLTLTGVGVADELPGLSDVVFGEWPGDAGVLAPGQSVTATAVYAARQADVDRGAIANSATATGRTLDGEDVEDEDTENLVIERTPAISLEKDAYFDEGRVGSAGDLIHYEFTVTNEGNTTLSDVVIDDPLAGLSAIEYTWPGPAGQLRPGQSATAIATYTVTMDDVDGMAGVTNTATVTATSPDGDTPTAEDTVTMPTPAESGIQLVKTSTIDASDPVHAGDVIEYRFAATNIGVLTLHDVQITDPMEGLSGLVLQWPGEPGVLATGDVAVATARYTVTQADVDAGRVVNTATVAGLTPDDAVVSDDDTETTVLGAVPAVGFDKTGEIHAGVWEAGDIVSFGFTITNDGNVTLADVFIEDRMPRLTAIEYAWPGEPGVLAPGESATGTAGYRLTATDAERRTLTNTAIVLSDRTDEVQDTVTLEGPPPEAIPGVPLPRVLNEIAAELAITGGAAGIAPIAAGFLVVGGVLLFWLRRRRTSVDDSQE